MLLIFLFSIFFCKGGRVWIACVHLNPLGLMSYSGAADGHILFTVHPNPWYLVSVLTHTEAENGGSCHTSVALWWSDVTASCSGIGSEGRPPYNSITIIPNEGLSKRAAVGRNRAAALRLLVQIIGPSLTRGCRDVWGTVPDDVPPAATTLAVCCIVSFSTCVFC